jgi:hypothetical protein
MDTTGFEPKAFRMRSGCATLTPCAPWDFREGYRGQRQARQEVRTWWWQEVGIRERNSLPVPTQSRIEPKWCMGQLR